MGMDTAEVMVKAMAVTPTAPVTTTRQPVTGPLLKPMVRRKTTAVLKSTETPDTDL